MSRRTKIIIAVIIAIVVIAIIIYLIALFSTRPVPSDEATNAPVNTGSLPTSVTSGQPLGIKVPIATTTPPTLADQREKTIADLTRMSMSFVERFGSYSNQSNYNNIEDLMMYMSQDMSDWAEDHIRENRRKKQNVSIYSGVSTRALSAQAIDFDSTGGTAEIKISTQRRESTGSTSNAKIYYQDIKVYFVQEDSVWKVDGAYWQ